MMETGEPGAIWRLGSGSPKKGEGGASRTLGFWQLHHSWLSLS